MSKFNRDNYLKTVKVNNVNEKELTTNSFSEYNFLYPHTYYTVSAADLQRPDVISYRLYGRIDLWWFLMKFNKVDDVWNELYIGQTLTVPDIRDVNNYVNEYK